MRSQFFIRRAILNVIVDCWLKHIKRGGVNIVLVKSHRFQQGVAGLLLLARQIYGLYIVEYLQ